ncbi:hypothetical protein EMIT0158MI4_280011 [Burkholderia ambifaria]
MHARCARKCNVFRVQAGRPVSLASMFTHPCATSIRWYHVFYSVASIPLSETKESHCVTG